MNKHYGTADIIALRAQTQPDTTAVGELTSGREWSYHQFDAYIDCLVTALAARGCQPCDRVAVLSKNSADLVALYFATLRIGGIFVPLNWRLATAEVTELIARSEPKFLLADAANGGKYSQAESLERFCQQAEISLGQTLPVSLPMALEQDRPGLLLFTSGTSGKPKGVQLSVRNLLASGHSFTQLTAVNQQSVFLCEAPMFHVIGLVVNIWPSMLCGGKILISDGYEPARTLQWLSDTTLGISHYLGVPQMVEGFRQLPNFDAAPLRRLTAILSGGGPHEPSDMQRWIDAGVTLVSGFGMSEAGTVFGMPPNLATIQRKLGSVGLPAPGVALRLVDASGNDCEAGQAGELWIRGDGVMRQYYQDEATTKVALTEDGWFKSGDILRRDADGYYWVMDRKKDMFISGGENVYPAEIEAVLGGYTGIKECAVVGVPDPKWGEVGCIVGVANEGCSPSKDEVLAFLKARLAGYKVPKHFVLQSSLPRTATGKLQKTQLKAQLVDALG